MARKPGTIVIALVLGLIGPATLILLVVAAVLQSSPEFDLGFFTLSTLYGASATFAAHRTWYQAPSAPLFYLAWCASIVAFNTWLFAQRPDVLSWGLVPGLVAMAAVLAWGFQHLRKECSPAA